MPKHFTKKVFILCYVLPLLLLCCPLILASQEITEGSSKNSTSESNNSTVNLPVPKTNSQSPKTNYLNPNNPWNTLKELIEDGMKGLNDSDEALQQLENELSKLKAQTIEQERLLKESEKLLASLKQRLTEAQTSVDVAIDRMNDAEQYAKQIDELNARIQKDVDKLLKQQSLQPLGVGLAFTGGVAGGTVLGLGVANQRIDFVLAGTGTIIGSGAIWIFGHYILRWW